MNDHIARAKKLTVLLDTKFSIFGIKFGFDPLLDLLPGIGSILGAIVSSYIFWIAKQLKVPFIVYFKIIGNILLDLLFGEIPLVGIFMDLFYKSNVRNLKMLDKYIKPAVIDAEIVE